jgi:hypothetical protein
MTCIPHYLSSFSETVVEPVFLLISWLCSLGKYGTVIRRGLNGADSRIEDRRGEAKRGPVSFLINLHVFRASVPLAVIRDVF